MWKARSEQKDVIQRTADQNTGIQVKAFSHSPKNFNIQWSIITDPPPLVGMAAGYAWTNPFSPQSLLCFLLHVPHVDHSRSTLIHTDIKCPEKQKEETL